MNVDACSNYRRKQAAQPSDKRSTRIGKVYERDRRTY